MKINKYLKSRLYIIIIFVITGIGGLTLFGYFWISDWEDICSKDEIKFNASNLEKTNELPPNFYFVWDKLYPNSRNVTMTKQAIDEVISGIINEENRIDCKCDDIGYISWNNDDFKWKLDLNKLMQRGGYRKFGFGLQKYSSPQSCFDFWINHGMIYRDKHRYFKNLNELSLLMFNRNIVSLKNEEIIELIANRLMEIYPTFHYKILEESKQDLKLKW